MTEWIKETLEFGVVFIMLLTIFIAGLYVPIFIIDILIRLLN